VAVVPGLNVPQAVGRPHGQQSLPPL